MPRHIIFAVAIWLTKRGETERRNSDTISCPDKKIFYFDGSSSCHAVRLAVVLAKHKKFYDLWFALARDRLGSLVFAYISASMSSPLFGEAAIIASSLKIRLWMSSKKKPINKNKNRENYLDICGVSQRVAMRSFGQCHSSPSLLLSLKSWNATSGQPGRIQFSTVLFIPSLPRPNHCCCRSAEDFFLIFGYWVTALSMC